MSILKFDALHMDSIIVGNNVKHSHRIISKFRKLEDNSTPFIPVLIETDGGDIGAAYLFHYLFEHSTKPVLTFTLTRACSAGSYILAHGDKGFRVATERAETYFHNVIDAHSKEMPHMSVQFLSDIDKVTNRPDGYWYEKVNTSPNHELYLDGQEIKDAGIVDHIGYPTIEYDNESNKIFINGEAL